MFGNWDDVDTDDLRDALMDEAGTAAFAGFPAAMADVVDLEDASLEELVERAEDLGWDPGDFED